MITYEYAGFRYEVHGAIYFNATTKRLDVNLVPAYGQHPAASRERHIRSAREMYLAEAQQHDADLKRYERQEFIDRGEDHE